MKDETFNVADAYHADGYDFNGTRKFDQQTGYRTKSLLTIPMKNHENDIIGVLQLIDTDVFNTFVKRKVYLKEALNNSILEFSEHTKEKCDFSFVHIFNESTLIENGGISLCR